MLIRSIWRSVRRERLVGWDFDGVFLDTYQPLAAVEEFVRPANASPATVAGG